MGYFYRLTWPATPEVQSVSVTGNFDNWQLSDKGTLVKTADSKHYETLVHVDQKQKLVFKFVVNGSNWTTDEAFKVEHDENGNVNNYVDAEELQLDEEEKAGCEIDESIVGGNKEVCSLNSLKETKGTQIEAEIEEDSKAVNDADSGPETKDDEISSDNYLETHSEEENSSIPETPATLSFPEIYSTVSENFSAELSEKPVSGNKNESGTRSFFAVNEDIDFLIFRPSSPSEHGADVENVSIAESSFTEVSYITSSSQYAFHDLGELSGPEEHLEQPVFPGFNRGNSAATVQEVGTGSPAFECLANAHDSGLSICSDYRSDEDEIDGIGDSISNDVQGGNFDQTGVFAKIRELFHF